MLPRTTTSAPRMATAGMDLEARAVGQPGAEVAGRAAHPHGDGRRQADADVVARVGIDDLHVLAPGARLADALVGLADGDLG
jgi:hypothetical protein